MIKLIIENCIRSKYGRGRQTRSDQACDVTDLKDLGKILVNTDFKYHEQQIKRQRWPVL